MIKISYGNKATVNIGNHENVNPFYNISVETEKDADIDQIKEVMELLKGYVDHQVMLDLQKFRKEIFVIMSDGKPITWTKADGKWTYKENE